MRFLHFFRRRLPPHDPARPEGELQDWAHSGLADEIEAFLAGRYVDFLAARHRPVPAWAVVNRLAHGTRDELARVVEGRVGPQASPPQRRVAWEEPERFLAAHLLARTADAGELLTLQLASLVPLELGLVERVRTERLDAEQVLAMSAEAVEQSLLG